MPKFAVSRSEQGMRADVLVAGKLPQFSRSALKTLFEKQNVRLNGQAVKPSHKLRPGDSLSIETALLRAKPEAVDLPIIYEDGDVVVINKPAGVLTHSKGSLNLEPTVASFLGRRIKDSMLKGNRAGIVHRLDRATSGLIIGAKNATALAKLQKQFSSRQAKKTYLAIVEGKPKSVEGVIEAPIARNPKKPQTFKVASDGKKAKTRYKLVKRSGNYSLLELQPETGRTHQIRVHLAYIGHPVVGDSLYGRGGDRLFLHAARLEVNLPNGRRRIFSVPLPKIFRDLLKS